MTDKRYTAVPGPDGSKFYYDENGNLAGSSVPGFFGSEVFCDENGKTAGQTVCSAICP